MKPRLILSLLASLLLAGCSATPLFPPEAILMCRRQNSECCKLKPMSLRGASSNLLDA